jgi:hypothetical protein
LLSVLTPEELDQLREELADGKMYWKDARRDGEK